MSRPSASPRRPAAARPVARRWAALAAVAALAGLVGCQAHQVIEPCPGVPVAVLDLTATRTSASCVGDTAPADGDQACQSAKAALNPPQTWTGHCALDVPTPDCCFDLLFKKDPPVKATIAYGALDASAAFCLPVPGAAPYAGTRVTTPGGDQLSFSLDTSGAVLSSCSATCAVTVHHEVTGLLVRDPVSGAVTAFTGVSTETASATPAATCTPCTAPCTATWSLTLNQAP